MRGCPTVLQLFPKHPVHTAGLRRLSISRGVVGKFVTRLTRLQELNLYDTVEPDLSQLPESLETLRIVLPSPDAGTINLGTDEEDLDLTRLTRLRHLTLVNTCDYDKVQFGADQMRCLTGLTSLHLEAFGPVGPHFLPPSMPHLVDLRMDLYYPSPDPDAVLPVLPADVRGLPVSPSASMLPVLPDAPKLSSLWLSMAGTAWERLQKFAPQPLPLPAIDLGRWPLLRHLLLHMASLAEQDVLQLRSLNLASLELRDCEFEGLSGMLLAGDPTVTVRDLPQKEHLEIFSPIHDITAFPGF